MSQEDSKSDASEPELWYESDCSDDVREYWDRIVDSRIDRIGEAPPPQQYSSAITSSIKALDEEQQFLEVTMEVIRHRCTMEEQALKGALETLREHLEYEEQAIARSITTIHRHRNLLVPVMRLPPEILSRIFVFHAQMESSWLNAALTSTRVCKPWRRIGRACPELWSHINFEDCRSAMWMARMIRRSRAVPLSFAISYHASINTQKMTQVVNNMHRFNSLDLDIPRGEESNRDFFEAFSQPAPALQHLTILNYGYSIQFAFPLNFLGGTAPNLRYMKVTTSAYVPWESGLFAHLVSLDVTGSGRDGDGNQPSLEMLLSALARMPGVETLILRRCFHRPTSPTVVYTHVDLPNLKWFEVAAPLTRCTCFLRHITINSDAIVRLDLKCSIVSKEDIEEFLKVFPSHPYTTPPTAQALKFMWGHYRPRDFKINMWTVQQDAEVKTSQNAGFKLNLSWEEDGLRGLSPLNLTWACFAALASPQLRFFLMSGGHIVGWDAGVWRKLASMVPNLRLLAPGETAQSVELCKALSPPDGSNSVPADCCFPALSDLDLDAPYDYPMPVPGGGESPLSVVLARSLAARALIGCSTPDLGFAVSRELPPEGWSGPFTDAIPDIRVFTGWRNGE
ncbi:hypothetical protein BD779DRAFT_1675733 [Infundibulicybe gibba]|nr:hypothetical protein BD779DRAFT_1675733 [Infundibulicybe gibba]